MRRQPFTLCPLRLRGVGSQRKARYKRQTRVSRISWSLKFSALKPKATQRISFACRTRIRGMRIGGTNDFAQQCQRRVGQAVLLLPNVVSADSW
jgi:hypothetical protein